MPEVVELVARAIYEASNHNKPYSLLTAFQREKCEREARAAIEAMREPTERMVDIGMQEFQDPCWPENVRCGFGKMIDAALKGK